MSAEDIAGLVVGLVLLGYLVVALLIPERLE